MYLSMVLTLKYVIDKTKRKKITEKCESYQYNMLGIDLHTIIPNQNNPGQLSFRQDIVFKIRQKRQK